MVISSNGVLLREYRRFEQPQTYNWYRLVENNLYNRLDNNTDNNDCQNTITKLRQAVNTICTFIHPAEYIIFITDIKNEPLIFLASDIFDPHVIPLIHDVPKLNSIYIFYLNHYKRKQCGKIKDVFTEVLRTSQPVQWIVRKCNQFFHLSTHTKVMKETLLRLNIDVTHTITIMPGEQTQSAGNFYAEDIDNIYIRMDFFIDDLDQTDFNILRTMRARLLRCYIYSDNGTRWEMCC